MVTIFFLVQQISSRQPLPCKFLIVNLTASTLFFILKKHRAYLLCFLFLGNAIQAYSQELHTSHYQSKSFRYMGPQWVMYIKPLSLIDPLTGTLQLGVEKRIVPYVVASVDYGTKLSIWQTGEENHHYAKMSAEVKYFLYHGTRRRGGAYYLALRGSYFPQQYRKQNDYVTIKGESYYYEYSDITRNAWTVDAMNGFEFGHGHFFCNPYAGIGLRNLSIHHKLFNPQPGYEPGFVDWDFSTHIDRRQGVFFRPDFCLGIRLGYRFDRRN